MLSVSAMIYVLYLCKYLFVFDRGLGRANFLITVFITFALYPGCPQLTHFIGEYIF